MLFRSATFAFDSEAFDQFIVATNLERNADQFYLASAVISDEDDGTLGTVPLPAGLPLLLAGLGALGIAARARVLAERSGRGDEIAAALERLTGADAMGDLFKVMALTAPDWPAGAGLVVAGSATGR